jgi:hypothetical protein
MLLERLTVTLSGSEGSSFVAILSEPKPWAR